MKFALHVFLIVLAAGSTFADEILHCALFDRHSMGGGGGHPLLREQMKRMKGTATPPRVGEQLFRFYREKDKGEEDRSFFNYHGKISISGKSKVEFNNWWNLNVPRRDLFDSGITVGVTKSGNALYSVDIDYLDKISVYGEYFRVRATGLLVPVRPNEWTEVGRFSKGVFTGIWCHLWIYLETTEPAPVAEIPAQDQSHGHDPKATYRLDVIFGSLPEATVRRMHTFKREHTRLTAMAIHPWESYSVICQSDKPFRFDAGGGELEKIKNLNYNASRLTQVEGAIRVSESTITLTCKTLPGVARKQEAIVIPLHGEMAPGAWTLQEVKSGPKMGGFYPRWDSGMVTRDNSFVNVAAYRITKL